MLLDKLMPRRCLAIACLLLAYAAYMCWLNSLVPYMNDDISYRFVVMYQQDDPVDSIGDIFTSQYMHYLYVNGRSVVHFLLQLIFMLSPGKCLFNICNSIVWVLLVSLVVKTAVPSGRSRLLVWIAAIVGVRFLLPGAYYLCFWASGSFNYIWTSAACLAYLLLYARMQRAAHLSYVAYPFLFILSFLIGWTHETLVAGVWVALLASLVFEKERRKPVSLWMFAGVTGGFLMMLFAPGNYVKMSILESNLILRVIKSAFAIFDLRLFYLLAVLLLVEWFRRRDRAKAFMRRRAYWFLALFVNLAFCCLLGSADRALYFVELTALILLIDYVFRVLLTKNFAHEKACVVIMLLALCGYEAVVAHESAKIYGEANRAVRHIYSSADDYTVFRELEPFRCVSPFVATVMDFCMRYNIPLSADYLDKLRFVPSSTYQAVLSGQLFDEVNRLPDSLLPFYTVDSIPSIVMPCDSILPKGKFVFDFYPPSLDDPNLSLLGRLRRICYPASLPSEDRAYELARLSRPYKIGGQYYVILCKPAHQWVRSVRYVPAS